MQKTKQKEGSAVHPAVAALLPELPGERPYMCSSNKANTSERRRISQSFTVFTVAPFWVVSRSGKV